jgi:hypothetical protein
MTKATKRPSYSNEFKQDAASLVLDKNYSYAEACEAVGVGPTALSCGAAGVDRSGIACAALRGERGGGLQINSCFLHINHWATRCQVWCITQQRAVAR